MITFGIVVVLVLVAVARYGADSRFEATDHRDPALPRGPQYAHTPADDLRRLGGVARRFAAQRRLWAAYDRHPRPWETHVAGEHADRGARPSALCRRSAADRTVVPRPVTARSAR